MASQSHGAAQQDNELSDLKIYCYERPRRIRIKKSYKEFASDEENSDLGTSSEDIKKRRTKVSKRKETPSQVALEKKQRQLTNTLRWLGENYELKEGMCLPRCVMYTHYLDFCKKNKLCPSGPATFGKVIRQKFSNLTTRRLGTRGQSKYHYYGIRVKESSQYFHAGYSKQGLTRFSTMKAKGGEGSMKKFALNSKARTLLPEFPNAKRLNLPKGVSQQKVETFIMMYRTHCQRLLDTVISANFDGIHNFILHFWQGMPSHMISVLQSPIVVDVIAICDSILYKVLVDVLIPSSIQDLPDSLREEIREFASNLLVWLKDSLSEVPKTVQDVKLQVAQTFGRALTRQVSFVHLAQTARSVLLSYDSVSRMISDIRKIDFNLITTQTVFLLGNEEIPTLTKTFVQEFEGLLSKQAPLEAYTEWLESVVDRCVLKDLSDDGEDNELFERQATKFLRTWSFITSKILEDLTLRSASSFGVFHLIHATFQEYALLIIENQKMLEVDKKLQKALQRHLKRDFVNDSIDQWVVVKEAEYEVRAETCAETKLDDQSDERQTRDKTSHNNNNLTNNNNIISTKPYTKKNNSRTKDMEASRTQAKTASRSVIMNIPQAPASSPAIVPRPISIVPSSISSTSTSTAATIARQAYSQLQLQSSVANNGVTDRQGRTVQQFLYNDDMVRNTTPGGNMNNDYHGQDIINPYDKTMFSSNLGISNPEFLTNPWFQPDNQSLTVLNNVGYADPNISSADNLEMSASYHRTGDFGFGYANELGISTGGLHPADHQNPINHRTELSYSDQGKDMDFTNYQNMLSRYNSMYFESMRNSGQALNSDFINYTGLLQTPTNSMDIEGILAHEAQMNRLGVGAV